MRRVLGFALVLLCGSACGPAACPEGTIAVAGGCVASGDGAVRTDAGTDSDVRRADAADVGVAEMDAGTCDPDAPDLVTTADVDENCDGVDGVVGDQVFVAPTGDDGNSGTRTSPFRTIARAIELADGRVILVAGDHVVADETEISAASPSLVVAIHGGFDATTWRRSASRSRLTVEGSNPALGMGLGLSSDALLERFDIVGADATLGGATYGLRVDGRGHTLTLRECDVTAGRAGGGADGARAPLATVAADGRDGLACVYSGTSCTGPAPATPNDSNGCSSDAAGYGGASHSVGGTSGGGRAGGGITGADGLAGEAGGNGSGGTAGTAAPTVLGTIDDAWVYAAPQARGGFRGLPGSSGGGGGGGQAEIIALCAGGELPSTTAGPGGAGGSGGEGGCGGTGGGGGNGGFASIALAARDTTVVLVDVTLATEGAGAGGVGQSGAIGGTGGLGGVGGRRVCHAGRVAYAGGPGGAGGNGGDGGPGAGGPGGPSIGLALLGTSTASVEDLVFTLGPGGLGGSSAGVRGADGSRIEQQRL